ncbi:hypothetical protein CC117_30195 [Parafrankia colletiae]|uniref:HTH cro/C1-type domain-containing protein n=1 Tax=Parafrankia colletiae TaxID=573497 RepID=A0A1S1Q4Y0_9ACTN|nr:hypothetical protein CC117_30195 [Parafrankia colletiae]
MRRLAGVSGRELAGRLGISQSKVSRIEAGRTPASRGEVAAWAKALGASDEDAAALVALAESALLDVRDWRTGLAERGHLQGEMGEREARARRTFTYQPSIVPGLLQTSEYARRVFAMFDIPYSPENLAAAVTGRMERHAVLYTDRSFDFLVTEAALRWCPGPVHVLLAQLDRLRNLSTLDNISLGLIPQGRPATTYISHSFVIYELDAGQGADEDAADNVPFVEVETIHANLTTYSPDDVRLYRGRWERLAAAAVFEADARIFLADLAAEVGAAAGRSS